MVSATNGDVATAAEKEPAMTGQLERRLGLFDSVGMIISMIVGTGIFISPKGVLQSSGSAGLSLIIWSLCGVITFIGAICYAELGLNIIELLQHLVFISISSLIN